MENVWFGLLELVARVLAATTKGIGTSSSMLVKQFRSRAIVGH